MSEVCVFEVKVHYIVVKGGWFQSPFSHWDFSSFYDGVIALKIALNPRVTRFKNTKTQGLYPSTALASK